MSTLRKLGFVYFGVLCLLISVCLAEAQRKEIEDEMSETQKRGYILACMALIHTRFDYNKVEISGKIRNSMHLDKSKLYDKYYFGKLKFCKNNIKEDDSDKIIESVTNENFLADQQFNRYVEKEETERVIHSRDISLELDEEELAIKDFIELEYKLDEYKADVQDENQKESYNFKKTQKEAEQESLNVLPQMSKFVWIIISILVSLFVAIILFAFKYKETAPAKVKKEKNIVEENSKEVPAKNANNTKKEKKSKEGNKKKAD